MQTQSSQVSSNAQRFGELLNQNLLLQGAMAKKVSGLPLLTPSVHSFKEIAEVLTNQL